MERRNKKENKEKGTKMAEESKDIEFVDKVSGNEVVDTDSLESSGAEGASELEALKKQLEDKAKQSEENYNKYLRMQADFDNYKKRVSKEREELSVMSLENIMKQTLPVVDNMERAIAAFKNDNLDSKYTDGIDMVYKQLQSVLEKNGLKEIEAEGMEFDPNVHHAVMQVDAGPENENKVVEVFQKGYTLGSKVIRPTMVKVAVSS